MPSQLPYKADRTYYEALHFVITTCHTIPEFRLQGVNLLAPELFFFNFSTPVYKMLIIQEPNTLELLNKLHFEKKKTESIYHV